MNRGEVFYPLHVRVCGNCFLAQLDEFVSPGDIFGEYAYFSSFSDAFVAHARRFVEDSLRRFGLTESSRVVEVGSNDGYLLQHFLPHGVRVLGIEPARNVAEVAIAKGIPSIAMFLGQESARVLVREHGVADLVIANNVLAHTPHLNDFVAGLAVLAGARGVVSVEFPHLMRLIERNQFDTIYHEHFSYYSFYTVCRIFESNGLRVFDVQEIDTHGGSLRVFATAGDCHPATPNVRRMHAVENDWGVTDLASYSNFTRQVEETKRQLLECLIPLRRAGKHVVGYGVPGKGNTLLNYCGIRTDLIDYMVDRNPYKQGKFTPGTRIPIYPPERLFATKPDYVLIMIWNLVDEVIAELGAVRTWGGQFIVPIPSPKLLTGFA